MSNLFVEIVGFTAGICTTLSFLPQIIKIYRTKRAEDISLLMYAVLTSGIFLWLVYGIFLGEMPLIMANSVSFLFCICILTMKVIYRKRKI